MFWIFFLDFFMKIPDIEVVILAPLVFLHFKFSPIIYYWCGSQLALFNHPSLFIHVVVVVVVNILVLFRHPFCPYVSLWLLLSACWFSSDTVPSHYIRFSPSRQPTPHISLLYSILTPSPLSWMLISSPVSRAYFKWAIWYYTTRWEKSGKEKEEWETSQPRPTTPAAYVGHINVFIPKLKY